MKVEDAYWVRTLQLEWVLDGVQLEVEYPAMGTLD